MSAPIANPLIPETEGWFRLFFDQTADAIFLLDPRREVFVECNQAALAMMGATTRAQILQCSPADLSPEFQPDGMRSDVKTRMVIEELMVRGNNLFEWVARRFDGTQFPIEVSLTAVQTGDTPLVAVVCRNISERKARQEALQRSEEQFRTMFERSADAMTLFDPATGRFVASNRASNLALGGAADARIEGASPAAIAPELQPDGRRSEDAIGDIIAQVLKHGSHRYEWALRRLEGTETLLENVTTAVQLGNRTLLLTVARNIEERKRMEEDVRQLNASLEQRIADRTAELRASEERLKALFTLSPLGMARVSWDGRFLQVNDSFARIIGRRPEEVLELTYWDVTPRDYEAREQEILETIRATGRFGPYEKEYLHRDGHRVPIVINGMLVHSAEGDHVWGIIEDITERKQAERALTSALEHERELSQLKSGFVSMVSHEFRTPLGIIQSSAEILDGYLEQLTPEERREQLESIIKNSRRMAGLMEEVLVLGRLDAGRMHFQPAPLDLAALCRRLVDEVLSTTDAQCPIGFHTADLPAEVHADERLLRHILLNLLTNAVKYSEPGQPVAFRACAEAGGIGFTVEDHGIGIPDAEQAELFKAFHRGSNVGQRQGTGLGLVIVKRCVELHGGEIRIASGTGKGTTVKVLLPLSVARELS